MYLKIYIYSYIHIYIHILYTLTHTHTMQEELKSLAPIGLYAAAAHGGSVLAMGAGAVSFAQIVKAGVCVCVCVCVCNTINTLADILNPKSN